ncbi:DDHD domain-containing protein [Lipomyces arxii]|uniref:DDHD domain-containing protein n=1 Tax=Lipomyces arxii TaxID=56418 RepID=UPI0034CFEBAB
MPPWFFHNATAPLDDPSAPLPLPSSPAASTIALEKETNWMPFTPEDNARLEAAWHALYVSKTSVPESIAGKGKSKKSRQQAAVSVIVGAARLYAVQFVPQLNSIGEDIDRDEHDSFSAIGDDYTKVLGPCVAKLMPVYWHAMHDTAHVVRATWFLTSSMHIKNGLPHSCRYASRPITDLSMASNLERGFLEMEPWSAAYISELNAVRETGRPAESKIRIEVADGYGAVYWPLLPEELPRKSASSKSDTRVDKYRRYIPYHTQRAGFKESLVNIREAYAVMIPERILVRRFAGRSSGIGRGIAWVLGAVVERVHSTDVRMPGRGMTGVVKRGFNYKEWARAGGHTPEGPWTDNKIEHLVLVVHGIGQKLSERVETFDFTYAINTFRVLMANQHAAGSPKSPPPAVLPVNWRRTINFDYEDSEPSDSSRDHIPAHHAFSLTDITPNTIPTVRNIISDVLLDIPYYLSRHRPRVLHAVVAEANRIYRLWMRNNPGWNGKVSIVAHSLGSVIATDILYRQPSVPPPLFSQNEHNCDRDELLLEFSVRNLFLVGSPVGFFLLLNRTNLIPRITSTTRYASIVQNMPAFEFDSESSEPVRNFTVEDIGLNHGGVYGCLAVENIYNIVHTSDPIAYRLNPSVDPEYATKLEHAFLTIPVIKKGFSLSFALTRWYKQSELQARSQAASQKWLKSVRLAGSRVVGDAVRIFKPNYRAGERIEENREALKRSKGIAEDERGILEPDSDTDATTEDSDSDSSNIISSDHTKPKRPPLQGIYSFARDLETSNSARGGKIEARDLKFERVVRTRMHCLNENGQIDYFIQPKGPLENQYISILTAHSGYWESKEFANLVAVECSRPAGVQNRISLYAATIK